MKYKITVAGLERSLPLCPLNDDVYVAAFVIFGDPELTTAAAKALLERAPEHDYILTAESKGIPLAHEMSRLAGNRKYFLARKSPKMYMDGVFEVVARSVSKGEQRLYIDRGDAELIRDSRILIVDDVISTGESLLAMEHLISCAGGTVAGKMSIFAEGTAKDRPDIMYLEELPLFDSMGNVLE